MVSSRFFLARLHSLSGVVPLGLFLLEHLFSNSLVLYGAERYDAWARWLHALPFLPALEVLLIVLPLVYHGAYGVYVTLGGESNVGRYAYLRNWQYLLQRITGVATLVFVVWHVAVVRVAPAITGVPVDFASMSSRLRNPWVLVAYTLGALAATFHFTNGLWGFAAAWGIAVGPHAQRRVGQVCWGLFAVLALLTASLLSAFASVG